MKEQMKSKGNQIIKLVMATLLLSSVFVTVVPTVNARIGDEIGLWDYKTNFNGFNKFTDKITKPMPIGIFPGSTIQMIQQREIERNFFKSIPDPAMEYNNIKFVEGLYNYQEKAMWAGSLLTGMIPTPKIPIKFDIPLDLGSVKFNWQSTGINLLRNNIMGNLKNMEMETLKTQFHEMKYTFRDYGITGFGDIKIRQQWTPGGDLGTMTRKFSHISNVITKIPNLGNSRIQNNQYRPISTTSYRMPSYNIQSSYR